MEEVQVAQHRGQGGLEVVGQKGHQVLPALLGLPGLGLPVLQGVLEGPQVLLQGPEFPGEGDRLPGLGHDLPDGGADLVQPAGEPPQGQVEGGQHQQHRQQGQPAALVVAEDGLVDLQGSGLVVAEEILAGPQHAPGEGVLEEAVHHHLPEYQCGGQG